MKTCVLGLCTLLVFVGSIWVGYLIFSTVLSHYGSIYKAGILLALVLPLIVTVTIMSTLINGLNWISDKLMSSAEREALNKGVAKLQAQEREQAAIRYAIMAKRHNRSSSYEPPSGLDVSDGGGS